MKIIFTSIASFCRRSKSFFFFKYREFSTTLFQTSSKACEYTQEMAVDTSKWILLPFFYS